VRAPGSQASAGSPEKERFGRVTITETDSHEFRDTAALAATLAARLIDVRAGAQALRAALGPPTEGTAESTPPASAVSEMTLALETRDRERQHLQREADDRLNVITEQLERIHQLDEELHALRVTRDALLAEVEVVRAAADERLTLLESNHRAYAEFRAELRDRLRDLLDEVAD
jgi:hypothetical protein